MTRTMGWLGLGLAVVGMALVTSDAEARHRRSGSHGGYGSFGGSFGGNGSAGGNGGWRDNGSDGGGSWGRRGSAGGRGSFGGLFSRHRGGWRDCYTDHGSNGGYGSHGGHGSNGGHGSHGGAFYSDYATTVDESRVELGEPPAAPEMAGESASSSTDTATPQTESAVADREI